MWWIIVLLVLVGIIVYLLYARIRIQVDSVAGILSIRYSWMVEVTIVFNGDSQELRLWVIGWEKKYSLPPTGESPKSQVKKSDRRTKDVVPGTDKSRMFRKLKNVMRSFRFIRCKISIDTENMALNGILYPWLYLLRWRTGRDISVNFWGENVFILEAENTIARMLWAYIKS